jgi:Domain of unknown function (DUF4145)
MFNSPSFKATAFQCPYCRRHAKQEWYNVAKGVMSKKGLDYYEGFISELHLSVCVQCNRYVLWLNDTIIHPALSIAPWPSEDVPLNIKEDFLEARIVATTSPRAACALLRLCLQKLMIHLGENGKNIELNIVNLVKKGLPNKFSAALLAVRAIGPGAEQPGKINLRDDVETAMALFSLINRIVESIASRQREINRLYPRLPKKKSARKRQRQKKTQIKKREIIPTPTILYR